MRLILLLSVWFGIWLSAGCAKRDHEHDLNNLLKERERVSYFDRNGDGKVDREMHHYVDTADADWELFDNDYNGRYEKKIHFGYAVTEMPVDIPVPNGVQIEQNP